jgi:hypothetical protein
MWAFENPDPMEKFLREHAGIKDKNWKTSIATKHDFENPKVAPTDTTSSIMNDGYGCNAGDIVLAEFTKSDKTLWYGGRRVINIQRMAKKGRSKSF